MENAESEGELLQPSELGTREYWDALYAREFKNNQDDADDEGTIWFSESNAEDAILRVLDGLGEKGMLHREAQSSVPASRFLDLGTGNGHLLFTLAEEDDDDQIWAGEMIGVDYSETSVRLARQVAANKNIDSIIFEEWDLLAETPGPWAKDGFDVILDKGTFDAISLMANSSARQDLAHPCNVYREKATALLRPGKFLCITSCNWTKAELIGWLAPTEGALQYLSEAKYPSFTFGGRTGQSIVTLLFQKRAVHG